MFENPITNSGKTPIMIVITAIIILQVISLRPYNYNMSAALKIDAHLDPIPEFWPKGFVIYEKGGYDGMYYYYVANDPLYTKKKLHNPYRYQRIFFSVLTKIIALDNNKVFPSVMFGINLFFLGLGMAFVMKILEKYKKNRWWVLLYGLSPPAIMTTMDLIPSSVSVSLGIIAIYYLIDNRIKISVACFAVAMLTREDAVLVFLVVLLWDFWEKRDFSRSTFLAISIIPFLAWHFYIFNSVDGTGLDTSSGVISKIPFIGIFHYFFYEAEFNGVMGIKNAISFSFFIFVMFAVWSLYKTKAYQNIYGIITLIYCILTVFTVASQWDNFNGLNRMFYNIYPFLILSFAVIGDRRMKPVVLLIGGYSLLTFMRIIFIHPVYPYFLS
ncbi:MAG: EpsG family protein [Nitrospinae bacterium]|nr:EpsG family protein [Nitrospinota bacterium]